MQSRPLLPETHIADHSARYASLKAENEGCHLANLRDAFCANKKRTAAMDARGAQRWTRNFTINYYSLSVKIKNAPAGVKQQRTAQPGPRRFRAGGMGGGFLETRRGSGRRGGRNWHPTTGRILPGACLADENRAFPTGDSRAIPYRSTLQKATRLAARAGGEGRCPCRFLSGAGLAAFIMKKQAIRRRLQQPGRYPVKRRTSPAVSLSSKKRAPLRPAILNNIEGLKSYV